MEINKVKQLISLWRFAEKDIRNNLSNKDIDSNSFYNNYNLIIHYLLEDIFGYENSIKIEDFTFNDDYDLKEFDEIWKTF